MVDNEGFEEHIKTLDYVLNRLKTANRSPDIEQVFRSLDALNNAKEQDIAPFVKEWDTDLVDTFCGTKNPVHKTGFLAKPPSQPTYTKYQLLKDDLLTVFDFLSWPKMANVQPLAYLQPLIRYAKEQKVCVATLNYDPFVERAAEIINIKACTGIESWQTSKKLTWDTQSFNLIKLHGSFEWWLESGIWHYNDTFCSNHPNRSSMSACRQLLFGQNAKLDPYGPFLELYISFKAALKKADRISIIGFSLKDDHITECLYQWLLDSPLNTIRIANGPDFKQIEVPARIRENSYSQELLGRSEIHPYFASEAISKWFCSSGTTA